ncbi:MAG: peptidoglycan DD-metalloendopeptidase family protein [Alistipes sp.]
MKSILHIILLFVLCLSSGCGGHRGDSEQSTPPPNILYGIDANAYRIEQREVQSGETIGQILNGYDISAQAIDLLDQRSEAIFPLRNIRAGQSYTAFIHEDSLYAPHLDFLAYERNPSEYVVFGFQDDSVTITPGKRACRIVRQKKSAIITSSLWGAIMKEKLPYALAAELEDIYQWTVDFFSIQKGDGFTVIYDEKFIDTLSIGIGRVWGVKFKQDNKEYYAIPFRQGNRVEYWEVNGNSLRKQLLKAPLKYTRISSRFSNARFHPIHRVYRPHHGVDYAAPKGTPVHAVANGVIIFKGWGGGGGNTLKIKHPGNLMTGYLHLSGFAKGIRQHASVAQGQLIGYVGSTGASTGPHLDFRIWRNGTAINPLSIPQTPAEPISEANRKKFDYISSRIKAELDGDIPVEQRITRLDSLCIDSIAIIPQPATKS